jgi:2,4-dienoyl-CoA reductase-like NADH-dependent reductase (Old Yellow Enzyme family)
MPTLFDPIRIGDLDCPNRIFMSPLTRMRATAGTRVPTELMREYYVQRAGAGLIISEATAIDPMGVGYPRTPGIWSTEQVAAWKTITAAIHNAGGRIFMQLWHVGRISHPHYLDGRKPLAPSAIAPEGHVRILQPQMPYVVPQPLGVEEIAEIVGQYRRAAENAQRAGFDGVEIHGANGYLLDQFLQRSANQRDDEYGGSIENRARLMLEVTDAVVSVWGPERVGMHLSPRGDIHSMGDPDLKGTFEYVGKELGKRRLAFLFAREYIGEDSIGPTLKQVFGGTYIANERFTIDESARQLEQGHADAIGFGMKFISNPDLPRRLRENAPLNEVRSEVIYGDGPEGYTDYPALRFATA